MWYNTLILHHSASRGWGGMTLYFMNHVLILLKSWNFIKLHIVNWDTTIFLLSLIIFIYLTLQHNSNKHKSKLLQWNLESAVKCMKILRDVIGTHIPTLILGTWIPTFTAHWELRFPHVHWELGFPENFWEWHTFGNFATLNTLKSHCIQTDLKLKVMWKQTIVPCRNQRS